MTRMSVLALAATLALGSMVFTTDASARGGHGGGHGGHWGGGHWGGGHGFRGFHGFRRGFFGFGPYWGGYYPYADCWRWRRVWTPFGWHLRRVNVCYYRYY